jgi:serine/threonine-protein kinase
MVGRTVSHYRITGLIGTGGMGDVYAADDLTLPRRVALKFIARHHELNQGALDRFITEAQTASSLEHPNICTIHEVGRTRDGHMFIAMPLYEGRTLAARIRAGPMDLGTAIVFAIEAASGLGMAHTRHIVHRDIKPANLMETRDALKILDFGLAKLTNQARATRTGDILGTLDYLSPEMAQGKPVDHRADIFSLGATLYEMVTGRAPFHAESRPATLHNIVFEDPPAPRSLRREIPRSLERVILGALDKNRNRRYQSMEAFRSDLLEVLRHVAPSRAMRAEARIRLHAGRKRPLAPFLLGALFLAVVAIGFLGRNEIGTVLAPAHMGHSQGVVVLPLEVQTTEPEATVLASGMGQVLVDRLISLTADEPGLWVVPPRKIRAAGVTDPAEAGSVYGASTIVTGSLSQVDGGLLFRIGRVDSGSQEVRQQVEFSLAGLESGDIDLDARVADLLQLDPGSDRNGGASPRIPMGLLMGAGYLARGDPALLDSALAALDTVIAGGSLLADAYRYRADALFQKGKAKKDTTLVEQALATARRGTELGGSQAEGAVLVGSILSYLGRTDEAILAFEHGIEENPRDPNPRRQLGQARRSLGQIDLAEAAYRDAVTANPAYWCAREDLGYFYYVSGRYDEATEQFLRVADLAPDYAPTYNYLGAIAYGQEDWDRAISMFERSFSLRHSYQACSNLGTLYFMTGRFQDAVDMYEWAREYNPSNHVVLGNIAAAYYWMPGGREKAGVIVKEAIALAEEELRKIPDDALLLSYLAGYYSVFDSATAVSYAEEALALGKDSGEVSYRCATVFEVTGQRARALVLLGDALEHGYSLKVIEHDRHFQALREDPRYSLLVSEYAPSGHA